MIRVVFSSRTEVMTFTPYTRIAMNSRMAITQATAPVAESQQLLVEPVRADAVFVVDPTYSDRVVDGLPHSGFQPTSVNVRAGDRLTVYTKILSAYGHQDPGLVKWWPGTP